MRRLLLVVTFMCLCSTANAALLFSVDGVVNPPDTEVTMMMSDIVTIGIFGDGQSPENTYLMGLTINSPASLDISGAGGNVYWIDEPGLAEMLGLQNPFVGIDLISWPPEPLLGTLVDNIRLHCEGLGDMVLMLFDSGDPPMVMDSQVLHEVPEPMTIALLAVGGLAILKRKH